MGEGFVAAEEYIFRHSLCEWSPSFCGRRRGVAAKPPQVTVSCLSGTTKGRSPSGGFAIALWKPSPDRSSNYVVTRRWQVAAALSAAVTTAKLIGDAPTLQAEPTKKKNHNSNASRSSGEGVWGGGASLREAASSPESPQRNLFRREREGGVFSTEKSPPSQILL